MDPLRLVVIAWILSLLLAASLLIVPRAAAAISEWRNLRRRTFYRAAIAQALAQEAREKELLELLAADPEPDCLHDLVGCILCRFDLEGHKS